MHQIVLHYFEISQNCFENSPLGKTPDCFKCHFVQYCHIFDCSWIFLCVPNPGRNEVSEFNALFWRKLYSFAQQTQSHVSEGHRKQIILHKQCEFIFLEFRRIIRDAYLNFITSNNPVAVQKESRNDVRLITERRAFRRWFYGGGLFNCDFFSTRNFQHFFGILLIIFKYHFGKKH